MKSKKKANKKKATDLRVVSVNPPVLSALPEPDMAVEVTLRFEVENNEEYEGIGCLSEWLNGTMDNADYDAEVGFPPGLGMPMVVRINERF